MSKIKKYSPAYFGDSIDEVQNASGHGLYKKAHLRWSEPESIKEKPPIFERNEPVLYAVMRDHPLKKSRNEIVYIGLSISQKTRFYNHPKVKELRELRGTTTLSFAALEHIRLSSRIESQARALEEIEHLLIWALWQSLQNERKLFTLPGMGTGRGNAWHVINEGYDFGGRMPTEIVYPWMLISQHLAE